MAYPFTRQTLSEKVLKVLQSAKHDEIYYQIDGLFLGNDFQRASSDQIKDAFLAVADYMVKHCCDESKMNYSQYAIQQFAKRKSPFTNVNALSDQKLQDWLNAEGPNGQAIAWLLKFNSELTPNCISRIDNAFRLVFASKLPENVKEECLEYLLSVNALRRELYNNVRLLFCTILDILLTTSDDWAMATCQHALIKITSSQADNLKNIVNTSCMQSILSQNQQNENVVIQLLHLLSKSKEIMSRYDDVIRNNAASFVNGLRDKSLLISFLEFLLCAPYLFSSYYNNVLLEIFKAILKKLYSDDSDQLFKNRILDNPKPLFDVLQKIWTNLYDSQKLKEFENFISDFKMDKQLPTLYLYGLLFLPSDEIKFLVANTLDSSGCSDDELVRILSHFSYWIKRMPGIKDESRSDGHIRLLAAIGALEQLKRFPALARFAEEYITEVISKPLEDLCIYFNWLFPVIRYILLHYQHSNKIFIKFYATGLKLMETYKQNGKAKAQFDDIAKLMMVMYQHFRDSLDQKITEQLELAFQNRHYLDDHCCREMLRDKWNLSDMMDGPIRPNGQPSLQRYEEDMDYSNTNDVKESKQPNIQKVSVYTTEKSHQSGEKMASDRTENDRFVNNSSNASSHSSWQDSFPSESNADRYNKPSRKFTRSGGLDNLGNTCFINSALQALYACVRFRNSVMQSNESKSKKSSMYSLLRRVFQIISCEEVGTGSLEDFRRNINQQQFALYQQNDAAELIRHVFTILDSENPSKHSENQTYAKRPAADFSHVPGVAEYFSGEVLHKFKCCECDTTIKTVETYYDMDLAFSTNNMENPRLEKIIESRWVPEMITNQWYCNSCKSTKDCLKYARLRKIPPYLLLSLLRFDFDDNTSRKKKKVPTATLR